MKNLFLLFLLTATITYAQTDWVKWEVQKASYVTFPVTDNSNQSSNSGFVSTLVSGLVSFYQFLISDLDGDNCPFYPSCSRFFVRAAKSSGIFKGTLMFVDRFTRDMNFFKGHTHYPLHKVGKFYDPSENYQLDQSRIKYIPSTKIVTE